MRAPFGPCMKLATFNAENFYMLLDRDYSPEEFRMLSSEQYMAMNKSIFNPNKDLSKIAEIAKTILEEDFDFVGLCEIGGLETLENFNRHFLDGRYDCFLHQKNSTRGIFVGALVRKGLFPAVEVKNVEGDFSRNLLKIKLSGRGVTLTVFVLHLKSQYGPDRGIEKRLQEVERLCASVKRTKCIVMGDFNGIVIRGQSQFEFEKFLELPFRDVLEAMNIPEENRFTHYYFGNTPNFSQLDYIFISNDMKVSDGGAIPGPIPCNFEERARLPSDHLFLKAVVRLF